MNQSKMAFTNLTEAEFIEMKRELQGNHFLTAEVVSDSMEPIIKVGESVTCEPLEYPGKILLKPFDIILFYFNNKVICHFVLKHKVAQFGEESILTVSYKYARIDIPVKSEHILGQVTSHRISFIRRLLFTVKFALMRRRN